MKVLILTKDEIKEIIDMEIVLKAVEQAFREKGLKKVLMPAKLYLSYDGYQGDLRVMPSYLKSLDISGVKIVNVHPNNPKLYNLPSVMALIALVNPKTGQPYAIMDGTLITAFRTGAASGVASKYLARKDASTLSLIGAGIQARSQLLAVSKAVEIKKVKVFDINKTILKNFIKEMSSSGNYSFNKCACIEECVSNADIICTVTPSRKPIIHDEWIQEGTHINAIGADAPGKQELDPNLLKRSQIVVDDLEQSIHSGEINVPMSECVISKRDIFAELGEIICGQQKGRRDDKAITIFDSTGLSIQDIVTASSIYQKAIQEKRGLYLDM